MKEKILYIVEQVSKYDIFDNCNFGLTLNYENVIREYKNPLRFNEEGISEINKELDKVDEVKSFNFTLRPSYGTDGVVEDYPKNWRESIFSFYISKDKEEDWEVLLDWEKYCNFNFRYLGDNQSLDGLFKVGRINGEEWYEQRHFKYEKIHELIRAVSKLDNIIIEYCKNMNKSYDELKNILE